MPKSDNKTVNIVNQHAPVGGFLFLTFLGAIVYFVQQSTSFWSFWWALGKALVWPAIVTYHVLGLLRL